MLGYPALQKDAHTLFVTDFAALLAHEWAALCKVLIYLPPWMQHPDADNLLCCCASGLLTKTRAQTESILYNVVAALLADTLATLCSLLAINTAQRAAHTLPCAALKRLMKYVSHVLLVGDSGPPCMSMSFGEQHRSVRAKLP